MLSEVGPAPTVATEPDRHRLAGRAADRASVEVNDEVVFGVAAVAVGGRRHLGDHVEAFVSVSSRIGPTCAHVFGPTSSAWCRRGR